MRIHPVAGIAAVLFLLAGVAVAVRGEKKAQALQHRRDEILADHLRRVSEIEKQLKAPTLDATTRERLERELDACKHEPTGIPAHFPHNERVFGYYVGASLAAIGMWCLFHTLKPKTSSEAE